MNTIRMTGLKIDCVGNYLSCLGLMKALSCEYPETRCYWDDHEVFVIITPCEDVHEYLIRWKPTRYSQWWKDDSEWKKATGKPRKRAKILRRKRSRCSDDETDVIDAHMVASGTRIDYNNMLGSSGGEWGKRRISNGWESAIGKLSDATHEKKSRWLTNALFGSVPLSVADIKEMKIRGLGTWFDYARKRSSRGLRGPDIERSVINPWCCVLAVEGSMFLKGGTGRRNMSHERYPRFPFSTRVPSPGGPVSEFWGPVWKRAARMPEIETVFRRGLARTDGRICEWSPDFAAAAASAGVDLGIDHFIRFSLRSTTAPGHTEESHILGRVDVGSDVDGIIAGASTWYRRYGRSDRKYSESLSEAIISVAVQPSSRRWRHLLGQIYGSYQHSGGSEFKTCPPKLSRSVFMKCNPGTSDRVSKAMSSVKWVSRPLLSGENILSARELVTGAMREMIDDRKGIASRTVATPRLVSEFLEHGDVREVVAMLGPCCMIEGGDEAQDSRAVPLKRTRDELCETYHTSAYLRPLLYDVFRDGGPSGWSCGEAREAMFSLLRDDWEGAMRVAKRYYSKIGYRTVSPQKPDTDMERLLISLLIPLPRHTVEYHARRYMMDYRRKVEGDETT